LDVQCTQVLGFQTPSVVARRKDPVADLWGWITLKHAETDCFIDDGIISFKAKHGYPGITLGGAVGGVICVVVSDVVINDVIPDTSRDVIVDVISQWVIDIICYVTVFYSHQSVKLTNNA